MARHSRVHRQSVENDQRAKKQRQQAATNRRKARRHVDTTVHVTRHQTTCEMLVGKLCTCE